jgi:hypothetical protein
VAYECGDALLGDQLGVELAAQYPGEPGKLFQALLGCRFIDELEEGRYQVHDLFDHAPDYVQSRFRKEAERKKDKTCSHCGTVFHSTETHARYCSHSCRQASYKKRQPVTQGDGGVRHNDEAVTKQCVTVTQGDEPPAPAPAPAPLSPPDKPAEEGEKKTAKKPRRRDDLFDAVAEVTQSDPHASGSHVAKVCKALREAEPPYTPAEVRALPAILEPRGFSLPLTPGTVEKYIRWTRESAKAANGRPRETDEEYKARLRAEREADQKQREQLWAEGGITLADLARAASSHRDQQQGGAAHAAN